MMSYESVNKVTVLGTLDRAIPLTELCLPDGRMVRVETGLLLDGGKLDGHFDWDNSTEGAKEVIPLIEEKLVIGKQLVETGKVRLIKTRTTYQEQLNEPLVVSTFDIERVVFNKPVEEVPEVRQEGETTVYSVVEEQMVLTKQLILREEVRVTRRVSERIDTQVVTLQREQLIVEREDLTR